MDYLETANTTTTAFETESHLAFLTNYESGNSFLIAFDKEVLWQPEEKYASTEIVSTTALTVGDASEEEEWTEMYVKPIPVTKFKVKLKIGKVIDRRKPKAIHLEGGIDLI